MKDVLINDEKYFSKETIERLKKKFKFTQAVHIEMLLWDFEIFSQLSEIHSNQFILKGGAATQLYLSSDKQRASRDIDFATNMTNLYDSAIERRITLHMEFKSPDYEARVKIFKAHFPKIEALSEDVDFEIISRKHEFSGGDIKNVVLTAARMTTYEKEAKISMKHLEKAADMIINNKKIMYGETKQKQEYMG